MNTTPATPESINEDQQKFRDDARERTKKFHDAIRKCFMEAVDDGLPLFMLVGLTQCVMHDIQFNTYMHVMQSTAVDQLQATLAQQKGQVQ